MQFVIFIIVPVSQFSLMEDSFVKNQTALSLLLEVTLSVVN